MVLKITGLEIRENISNLGFKSFYEVEDINSDIKFSISAKFIKNETLKRISSNHINKILFYKDFTIKGLEHIISIYSIAYRGKLNENK